MRKLIMKDIITVAKIMKKADLKTKVNDILKFVLPQSNTKDDKDDKDIKNDKTYNITVMGANCIIAVIEILGDSCAEQDIYNLLTDIFEEDSQTMELDKLIKNLEILFEQNNILNFLKSASQLM